MIPFDDTDISIRETTVDMIRPLRHVILRAGLRPEAAVFDGDDEPTARHLAAFDRCDEVVGCVSIVRRPFNGEPAWQLRGMAIAEQQRGRGIGRALLSEIDLIVRSAAHSPLLWCNARTPAVGFYAAHGGTPIGPEFTIETAGPHYQMWKRISTKPDK